MFSFNSYAQPVYQQLTITDGLPGNHINSIFEDNKGFIWVTSNSGFARYDGHRFKNFRYDPATPNSIKGNAIKNLQQAADGNIWVCQHAGLSKLNTTNWQVENFSFADSVNGKRYDWEVFEVYEENGTTLVASSKGLRQLDKKTQLLLPYSRYPLTDSINTFGAKCFVNYNENTLLIGTWQGLVVLNKKTGKYQRYVYPQKKEPGWPTAAHITCMHTDENKKTWIGWWGGALSSFDLNNGRFETFSPIVKNQQLKWLVAANIIAGKEKNSLYITDRYQELYEFNTVKKEWKVLSPAKLQNTNATFHNMLIDKNGIFWLGTSDGLFVADPSRQIFETHLLNIPTVPGADNGVLAVYKDEADSSGNTLWFSGYNAGNIFTYNLRQKKIRPLPVPLKTLQNNLWEFYESFVRDGENNLWISCSKGIFVFNEKLNRLSLFNANGSDSSWLTHNGNLLLKTKQNHIFAGGSNNISFYDPKLKNFKPILHDTIFSSDVIDICKDMNDNIWVARVEMPGKPAIVSKINSTDLTHKNFNHAVIKNCIYGTGRALKAIYARDANAIYIGTSFGLFRGELIADSLALEQATVKEGFFAGQVEHIRPENDSIIWIQTSDGIYRHNMNRNTYSRIGTVNGMLNNFPNSMSVYNGQVFLGYQDGNMQLLNSSMFNKTKPPKVFITGFKANGTDFLPDGKDISAISNFDISYRQNSLRFEFTALDYTNPQLQLFKYKLEGYDKDWISSNEPFAVYNNLDGGNYIFRVKGADSFGNWNEEGASIQFHVAPPFWKTTGFLAGCLLLFLLSVWYFYKQRIKNIRRQEGLKQQRLEAEMTALRSQMNPHFIFNCLNTIDGFIVTNKADEASELLQKFSRLMRQVLENSSHSLIPVMQEIDMLRLYVELEKEVMENKFSYRFDIDNRILNNANKIPTLLLQPFIENAILHGLRHKPGKDGLLTISMQLKNQEILATIEDNGIGREAAAAINKKRKPHDGSFGIKLAKQRLEQISNPPFADLIRFTDLFNNEISCGTRADIKIPVLQ